ncbi:MAG: thiolase family protein [Candidatus Abyssobacteria bacterium SURF_17]|uniref:Thiolase family protein n=1 Tax=Candidatus Abyssobacteria bacterium SURF_17 TaxID=2093361 RepID=A0A419F9F0_9BACT|nr:MAG: thiolase family protein [Candidatus Abyssubacteria bacterium SURF_17]
MRDVYVIGAGMTRFGKYLERNMKSLAEEAVTRCLEHAAVGKDDLQAAWVGNAAQGLVTGQEGIRGQVVLRAMGIGAIPVMNVENACASASSAFYGALMGIGCGLYDVALALGMEKLYMEDKAKSFQVYWASTDVELMEAFKAMMKEEEERKKQMGAKAAGEGGAGKSRSAFMDIYSLAARSHMKKYGTTQRQLAVISAKNHFHSTMNPYAQYQMNMTVEEVLAAPEVSYPLTRPMCSPVGDGAAAAILCSKDFAKKIGANKLVKVKACVLGSGRDRDFDEEDLGKRLSRKAYEVAGVGPQDINVAEVHDATAFGELSQTEDMGFCGEGEGGPFAESGATTLGGKVPVNTSGGLESRGHPIGATGLGQICDLTWQLRGECGKRQVEGARLALAENGGGNIGIEEAAMVITILEKAF